jgi:PIN domain nuclease of toxin-antitoxin system
MILLDTHSLLWVLTDSDRLGAAARASLTSARAVYSSSISVVEITVKTMLGKLAVPDDYLEAARESGIRDLPYTHEHALALQRFPQLARHDPFDRMLAAQASADGLTLMTADAVLLGMGEAFVQDSRR